MAWGKATDLFPWSETKGFSAPSSPRTKTVSCVFPKIFFTIATKDSLVFTAKVFKEDQGLLIKLQRKAKEVAGNFPRTSASEKFEDTSMSKSTGIKVGCKNCV